jgi:hypothetical protein
MKPASRRLVNIHFIPVATLIGAYVRFREPDDPGAND